jgi:hypothetical protein
MAGLACRFRGDNILAFGQHARELARVRFLPWATCNIAMDSRKAASAATDRRVLITSARESAG